jgi:hypothetical protein
VFLLRNLQKMTSILEISLATSEDFSPCKPSTSRASSVAIFVLWLKADTHTADSGYTRGVAFSANRRECRKRVKWETCKMPIFSKCCTTRVLNL